MGCLVSKQSGAFPVSDDASLWASDTNIVAVENVPVTMIFQNLVTPHKEAKHVALSTKGSVIVSDQRLVGHVVEQSWRRSISRRQLHVPFAYPCPSMNIISNPNKQTLCIKMDLSRMHEGYEGTMELFYQTPHAQDILKRVKEGFMKYQEN